MKKIKNKLINLFNSNEYSSVDRLLILSFVLLALSILILWICVICFIEHDFDIITIAVDMVFCMVFGVWLIIIGFVIPALIPLLASIIILIKAIHMQKNEHIRYNEYLRKAAIITWSVLIGSGALILVGDLVFYNM